MKETAKKMATAKEKPTAKKQWAAKYEPRLPVKNFDLALASITPKVK